MTTRALTLWAIASAFSGAACTMNQTEVPGLTGPSTFATSVTVTANPDTVFLNGQQSVVIVEAHDATGAPMANLRVHLDIVAGDVVARCGRLSLTEVTTASDGRAGVVYTTPSWPPLPLPECNNAAAGISIVATPVGTNAQASNSMSAGIRFLTPSSNTPSSAFGVNFLITPNPGKVGVPVAFSDAGSVSPGHTITSFRWDWSDGAAKTGSSVAHDFGLAGTYTATLTVTDDVGQSGFKTALVTITN